MPIIGSEESTLTQERIVSFQIVEAGLLIVHVDSEGYLHESTIRLTKKSPKLGKKG